MTNEEFIKEYNYAPWDDEELAEAVIAKGEGELQAHAKEFFEAREKFLNYLEEIGYERG